jgi:transmembrane sensor
MVKERFIEIVDKYLSGSATDSEKQLVEEYLTRLEINEANDVKRANEQKLKEEIWQQVELKTRQQRAEPGQLRWYKTKAMRSVAVAATIILVVGLAIILYNINRSKEPALATKDVKQIDSIISVVHHEKNATGKQKSIQLPDGSLIVLANESEITWREPFINKRDIILVGKAYFKVAKNKTKPFTVISSDISTTALGTQFTVTTLKKANRIIIRLYEGKVVVRSVLKGNRKLLNDVYLLPGQVFIYGNSRPKVRTFKLRSGDRPEQVINRELEQEDPTIPQNNDRSWYMFNNELLQHVLDQLAEIKQVKIIYDKKDVQNIYFTGRYNSSDSIETILKQIGTLNNLTITTNDNAFTITK